MTKIISIVRIINANETHTHIGISPVFVVAIIIWVSLLVRLSL